MFDIEKEIRKIGDHMMTFDEFKSILKKDLDYSLSGFPKEEVQDYWENEVSKIDDIRGKYEKSVERYKVTKLQPPNLAFLGALSQLGNVLWLSF